MPPSAPAKMLFWSTGLIQIASILPKFWVIKSIGPKNRQFEGYVEVVHSLQLLEVGAAILASFGMIAAVEDFNFSLK